jgi:hypothetical protein
MFRKQDPDSAKILAELQTLKRDVAKLRGEKEALDEARKTENNIITLKKELTTLQIERDREKEKHDREKREVEHMVGLQRKRGDFETKAAAREARLDVREENLEADKKRFDEHVTFIEERFAEELKQQRKLMERFLERMPTTKQLISVGGGNGNGGEE